MPLPDGLQAYLVKVGDRARSRDSECPICTEPTTDAVVTDCLHVFCTGCIRTWLSSTFSRHRCPKCRTNLLRSITEVNVGHRRDTEVAAIRSAASRDREIPAFVALKTDPSSYEQPPRSRTTNQAVSSAQQARPAEESEGAITTLHREALVPHPGLRSASLSRTVLQDQHLLHLQDGIVEDILGLDPMRSGSSNSSRIFTSCVGYAPSQRRRCRIGIAAHNTSAGKRLLRNLRNTITESEPDMNYTQLKADLVTLAQALLCQRFHQKQDEQIAERWLLGIRAYVERFTPQSVTIGGGIARVQREELQSRLDGYENGVQAMVLEIQRLQREISQLRGILSRG